MMRGRPRRSSMAPVRTDEQIKIDVVNELHRDTRVDASKVQVVVDNGCVALSGRVPTAATRAAATVDAWSVAGVRSVDNGLKVELPPMLPVPDDATIAGNADSVLDWSTDIDASDVKVDVEAGVLGLSGTVPTHWEKIRAEELVENLRGVTAVDNELAVVPTQDIVDELIADDVVSALDRNALVDVETVDVTVRDGIVTLSGTVPSAAARFAAYRTASRAASVRDVRSELIVAI
ncbi:BON domain-containing protein [bacterium]|nr:BON domain-containing protein [bacterium]